MNWDANNPKEKYQEIHLDEYQNVLIPHKYKYGTLEYCRVTVYYCHGKRHAACCDNMTKDIYIY